RFDGREVDLEVRSATGEHLPHRAGPRAAKIGEDWIREPHVVVVAGRHRRAVFARKSFVEPGDELCVRVHQVSSTRSTMVALVPKTIASRTKGSSTSSSDG